LKKDLELISNKFVPDIKVRGRFKTGHGHLLCHFKFKDPKRKIVYPQFEPGSRQDELWKETCLEAFIYQPSTKQYLEINFSPRNGAWNAYLFESYRKKNMKQPEWQNLKSVHKGMGFEIPLVEIEKLLGPPPYRMALTSVIKCQEECHYFAIAHLDQVPNFHYSPSYIEPLKY